LAELRRKEKRIAANQFISVVRMIVRDRFPPGCGIRGKAATDSDGRRPSIPIESDHPIRTKVATLLMG
jgi:hypothetical protein